jgi:hypothetical protein
MKKSMVIGLCGAHFVFSIYVGAKELLLNLETSGHEFRQTCNMCSTPQTTICNKTPQKKNKEQIQSVWLSSSYPEV